MRQMFDFLLVIWASVISVYPASIYPGCSVGSSTPYTQFQGLTPKSIRRFAQVMKPEIQHSSMTSFTYKQLSRSVDFTSSVTLWSTHFSPSPPTLPPIQVILTSHLSTCICLLPGVLASTPLPSNLVYFCSQSHFSLLFQLYSRSSVIINQLMFTV